MHETYQGKQLALVKSRKIVFLYNTNVWRSLTATTQTCCEQFWTSPGGNTPQSTNYMATYLPSRKLPKLDEPDMQDTAGEAVTSSSVMLSYGTPHMAEQKQDDQLEHTYRTSVRIRDVALRTYQKRWSIERSCERGSGISVLTVRQDDDDNTKPDSPDLAPSDFHLFHSGHNALNNKKNSQDPRKKFEENFINSILAEFYLREINQLPDR